MLDVQNKECITPNELMQLMSNKSKLVKIIDVRNMEEYNASHIPWAINIELLEIDLANKIFDKEDLVITVCGKGGGRSAQASEKLKELGFKNSAWLCGGTFGWQEKNTNN